MSRIIIKNLPSNTTENALREKLKEIGNITDIKLKSKSRYAFVGFQSQDQAAEAANRLNNTYINLSKVTVEIAKDFNDKSRPKSVQDIKKEKSEAEKKREEAKQLRLQMSRIRSSGKGGNSEAQKLLEKYKDDPQFQQFVSLHTGAEGLTDYNELQEENKAPSESAASSEHDQDDEAQEQNENRAKEEVSDLNYWQSLIKKSDGQDEEQNNNSNKEKKVNPRHTTPKKVKEFKKLPTICFRFDKYPKRNGNVSKDKKKKCFDKKEIAQFFKPLKCAGIRNSPKNRFEYFIAFQTEKLAREALQKHRSFLCGVRITLSSKDVSSSAKGTDNSTNKNNNNAPWAEAAKRIEKAEPVAESGKLFIRNLCYQVTEEALKEKLEEFGVLSEFELPVCHSTRKLKGFATITYMMPRNAVEAMNALDGSTFMGRVMHVLPYVVVNEEAEERKRDKSSFKDKKEADQKDSVHSSQNWNTLFINSSAVADILAKRYNKTKEQILSSEGGQSAGVTLALGETQIVDETRRFLEENGVSIDAFMDLKIERSRTVFLIKGIPAHTNVADIAELCGRSGELGRVLMPPSGTTCIVEYLTEKEATDSLQELHCRKFGSACLLVERAPIKTFKSEFKKVTPTVERNDEEEEEQQTPENASDKKKKRKRSKEEQNDADVTENPSPKKQKPSVEPEAFTTIYVKNLAHETTEDQVKQHFSSAGEVFTIILAMKGEESRGYGFVQFIKQKDARKALISLEGSMLDGRSLELKLSEKKLTSSSKSTRKAQEFGQQNSNKISVKNIPFQCTRTDIDPLFKPFGPLKRVFLQKHHSGQYNNGGYGFVEFINKEDAKRALTTMGLSTHLHGRRLVLQWAKDDETVEELRQKTAEKYNIAQTFGSKHKKIRHVMRDEEESNGIKD